jgi:hypothetical protein
MGCNPLIGSAPEWPKFPWLIGRIELGGDLFANRFRPAACAKSPSLTRHRLQPEAQPEFVRPR